MNLFNKILFITVVSTLLFACQNADSSSNEETNSNAQLLSGKAIIEETSQRSSTINMEKFADLSRFTSTNEKLVLSSIPTIKVSMKEKDAGSDEDVQTMVTIFNTFMTAEKEEEQLDLSFEMSDEPVETGVFLFSINTEKEQDLTFQMYDEEGFELAADNQLSIKEGANYKALNVNGLEDGTYLFRLKNKEGQELVRKVSIQQN